MSSTQCPTATPVCNTATMSCVACTATDVGACGGFMPVCGSDGVCRGCSAHAECASNACLPDGSCGDDTNVAYVDPSGANNTSCSRVMPCPQVTMALSTNRPFVKLHGTIDEAVLLSGRDVTFLADIGTVLKNSVAGTDSAALKLSGTGHVQLYDLTIANSTSGIFITQGSTVVLSLTSVRVENNANGGIVILGGTLTMARSAVSDNTGAGGISTVPPFGTITVTESTFAGNSGGQGLSLQGGSLVVSRSTFLNNINGGVAVFSGGTFVIVGNMFFNNGSSTSTAGGVSINTSANALNRLDFNSFAQNKTMNGSGPAIHCDAGNFTARNNIMSNNAETGATMQFGGSCAHAFSISTPGVLPSGPGNSAADPLFVDPAVGNLHLQANSPARRAADPASDLTGVAALDIDGDQRSQPAEIGADQVNQ